MPVAAANALLPFINGFPWLEDITNVSLPEHEIRGSTDVSIRRDAPSPPIRSRSAATTSCPPSTAADTLTAADNKTNTKFRNLIMTINLCFCI